MELELKEEEREMEELDRYSNSFSSNFVGFFRMIKYWLWHNAKFTWGGRRGYWVEMPLFHSSPLSSLILLHLLVSLLFVNFNPFFLFGTLGFTRFHFPSFIRRLSYPV